jgi:hypothetical protein
MTHPIHRPHPPVTDGFRAALFHLIDRMPDPFEIDPLDRQRSHPFRDCPGRRFPAL